MSNLNEGRAQIKRQYGQYSKIRVNEKAPIRNKILDFVGKRFVTETELKNHLTKITEEIGKDFDQRKWFKNNQKYFESFENRGQKVWTLSKYGKRVHEFINKPKENTVNENASIGLFKKSLFESVQLNESLAAKAFDLYDTVDIIMDEFDDKASKDLHAKACELLGEDPSNVCRLDSESDYDDALLQKAYDTMDHKFRGTTADLGNFKLDNGMDLTIDPKMHVVRLDDYGFVCYFFTSNSKF